MEEGAKCSTSIQYRNDFISLVTPTLEDKLVAERSPGKYSSLLSQTAVPSDCHT
jgi:hypothetical protein